MMRVLVTRPECGARRTAERLTELGAEPVLLPLTRIDPLPFPDEFDASGLDAVAATSANALRHAAPDLLAAIARPPCFVVGEESANAARRRGLLDVRVGDGDAAGLARLLASTLPRGGRLLYLCGRLRRPEFEAALAGVGIAVAALETYETLAIDYTSPELAEHLGNQPVDAVLVYSAEAAIALLRLIKSIAPHAFAARTRFICISPRVAAVLGGHGLEIVVAQEPTEGFVLSALRDISSVRP